ncbi:MAG: ATP-binding protein [Candidatus Poribacteria bacterium]|nr:ATP-binding protein [Candidatus Poribacteria bacterium]
MTVRLKNIGILKQAEFSLGDLTLICGENNTGKTYATYALYSFLESWREFINIPTDHDQIRTLLTDGALKIDLAQYIEKANQMLAEACKKYLEQLDKIFAASEGTFQNSEFHIEPSKIHLQSEGFRGEMRINQEPLLRSSKEKGIEELIFTLAAERKERRIIDSTVAADFMSSTIGNAVFSNSFPRPFISSAERTGVAIFRKELDFARNRLIEEMGRADQKTDLRELLFKAYQNYPEPVKDNVNFTRQLEDIAKSKSFIAKEHPEILEDFADIIGGDYVITQNDQLYYIPKGTRLKLTMVESSSSVRSLLDISFYLRHIARKGDLLMVDEPELSLHPENQRRIARLFARLANIGVKVFVTTHSDYIVKELNTLIMLNHDKPHLKKIVEENGYQESELINADQVKLYVAEEQLMPLEEGQKRRRRGHTLVPAKIHPRFGIAVPSFDKTIDDMNRIQDEIVWGAE